MLRSRIIPSLLIHNKGLYKTINFSNPKYIGDPINTVKIFNEKEVDELILFDIDATVKGEKPDFKLIAQLAAECRMPICYGGGVKTLSEIEEIISLGVEKVSLSSSALKNPQLIKEASKRVGSQSIVVTLDVLKTGLIKKDYRIYIKNGKIRIDTKLVDFCKEVEQLGAGEIIINSINNDGVMKGYDFELVDIVRNSINLPISVLGGAGKAQDIKDLISRYKIIGASAGSFFIYKGKYKAVLIQYPNFWKSDDFD